jgi:fructose-1,6-bisphosphatase/inositol monophosphatase family enzyme
VNFVDKKSLLSLSLASIMLKTKPDIKNLLSLHPHYPGNPKADGSPVTPLDLALSELLEAVCRKHYPEANVFSEENYQGWSFPLIAIDPLDGTKEYIKQRPEWAVSVGYFPTSSFVGEGWVYNPASNELFDGQSFTPASRKVYQGEVSHSEWECGWYENFQHPKFQLKPVGSIAYKLGRLSEGKIDFVVSLAPKNIWDIAGGSLLCQQQGIKFYSEGKEVTDVQRLYEAPLIWCREELWHELSSLFPSKGIDL